VIFWCGCGTADPYLWQIDLASDRAVFVSDLQDGNKKFFCLYVFGATFLHHFSKIKSCKEETKYHNCNQGLFVKGTDPGIRIRTSDKQIRIRIVLLSSETFKMATKSFFAYTVLKLHFYIIFQR
jgi:hypothetical protein